MINHGQHELRKELKQAGASDSEIRKLTPIALNLAKLKVSNSKVKSGRQQIYRWTKLFKPILLLSSGTILGIALVIFSQSVLPTSLLYPIQELSDSAAVTVHPEYRATVMMRRAQQVNQLVVEHAEPHIIMATLASYNSEAAAYKSTAHANYAAFEYCKTSLQQAAIKAPTTIRQSILSSIKSLET